jgi:L-lactate utilization protein LutB
MCTTLPEVLITVMGIEKVLPRFADLEVMPQLLPRSSTAERMNPYTTLWSGTEGRRGSRGAGCREPARLGRGSPARRARGYKQRA